MVGIVALAPVARRGMGNLVLTSALRHRRDRGTSMDCSHAAGKSCPRVCFVTRLLPEACIPSMWMRDGRATCSMAMGAQPPYRRGRSGCTRLTTSVRLAGARRRRSVGPRTVGGSRVTAQARPPEHSSVCSRKVTARTMTRLISARPLPSRVPCGHEWVERCGEHPVRPLRDDALSSPKGSRP
jgi:hypothetical protein